MYTHTYRPLSTHNLVMSLFIEQLTHLSLIHARSHYYYTLSLCYSPSFPHTTHFVILHSPTQHSLTHFSLVFSLTPSRPHTQTRKQHNTHKKPHTETHTHTIQSSTHTQNTQNTHKNTIHTVYGNRSCILRSCHCLFFSLYVIILLNSENTTHRHTHTQTRKTHTPKHKNQRKSKFLNVMDKR